MSPESTIAAGFADLHRPGRPLVLFNAWDAGSARAVAAAGATAIATGSWSVAAAHGLGDGEQMPLDLVLANLRRIAAAVDLPVTVDLEGGYGETPEAVAETMRRAVDAGAVGCNIEDSFATDGSLRPVTDQVARLRAARAAAAGLFINARTDIFFQRPAADHESAMVDAAIERAQAYAAAGADGIFVPGLVDAGLIGAFVARSPLPVNVMVAAGTPPRATLASLGVARISHGPGPFIEAMRHLEAAARAAMA